MPQTTHKASHGVHFHLWQWLVCLLFPLFVQAQDDSTVLQYTRFTYPDGVLCSEGMMRNGLPDGVWKNYHPNGVLKSVGKRLNTLLDSIWVFYDERGLLAERVSYQNGQKNGYAWHYAVSKRGENYVSVLKSRELYVANRREGMAWQYDDAGRPQLCIPYLADRKEGLGFGYDADSSVVALYRYHNNQLLSIETINKRDASGQKQGVWKTFYPDGTLKTEENYENDKLSGYQKTFDRFGRTQTSRLYQRDSLLQARDTSFTEPQEQLSYYDNGTIRTRGTFRNGVPIGIHRSYSLEGKVVLATQYDNDGCLMGRGVIDDRGRKQGAWIGYDPVSELKIESGIFRSNERVGVWQFYYPSGRLQQQGEYQNNLRNGVWQWFYEGGQLRRRQEFTAGKAEGLYLEYDTAQVLIAEGNYIDDKRDGQWRIRTGSLIESGAYREGEKNGRWTAVYGNGQIAFTGVYSLGLAHGKHVYYFENGTLEHIERYRRGQRIKKWFYYNQHNQLYILVVYKSDQEKQILFFPKSRSISKKNS